MSRDYILALIAALGSLLGSSWAIKAIIKHENYMCDKRMEAFREGLKHGEEEH